MEPVSIALTLGKLLGVGYSLFVSKGPFEFELGTHLDLVDFAPQLASAAGQFVSWTPSGQSPRLQAKVLGLLTTAFGCAFHEHFGSRRDYGTKKHLEANFEAAVHWASGPMDEPQNPPVSLEQILRDPEKTAYFGALWRAFNKTALPGKVGRGDIPIFHQALIENPTGADRQRFEAIFRRTVKELLATPASQELCQALLSTKPEAERAEWVEGLVVGEMANWGSRHVFGNVRGHTTLPWMPLEQMYVQPNAKLRGIVADGAPICGAIRSALKKNPLVVVSADFGHGKSLTARILAYEAAKMFLGDGNKPRAELERPVFIKCQSAVTGSGFELARAVRQAQWEVLKAIGIDALRDTDPALALPADSQRTLYLVDGLDELAFLERDIVSLFQHLRGQLTGNHRAVVFSRPHTLPWEKLKEWGIPVFELQPFDTGGDSLGQVGTWLSHWNACSGREPIEPKALAESGLIDLARTPILLFMIAYTWGDMNTLYPDWKSTEVPDAGEVGWDRLNRLYESFFRAIAFGKYEQDRDKHPTVIKAAERLLEVLEERGLLSAVASATTKTGERKADEEETGKRHLLTEAMLWLMSRIAWEAHCLEQVKKPKQLRRRNIEALLEDELKIEEQETVELVLGGLLLSMQADLSESTRPILFGHKSFREFLVGRCWASLLGTVTDPQMPEASKEALILVLRGGSLLREEDRSFDFLRARLRQWNEVSKKRLSEWAHQEFSNERLENPQATIREDTRGHIRTAALALAATLAANGYELKDGTALRSLLASHWVADDGVRMWAPRLQAPGVKLNGANLFGADLSGANLSGANLSGANLFAARLKSANLEGADLSMANLSAANLYWAHLSGANLSGAKLSGANLVRARLDRANLLGANLDGANLEKANLSGAILFGANLNGANLSGAILESARLESAILFGANLNGANLSGAILSGAILVRARLDGAILEKANLVGAHLVRADLEKANLDGANLSGANLSGANLSGANLFGTNLEKANLVRANLFGTNLFGANLEKANLDGANLFGANLNGTNLDGANLVGTNLFGTILFEANLDRANLFEENMEGAKLTGAGRAQAGANGEDHAVTEQSAEEEGESVIEQD